MFKFVSPRPALDVPAQLTPRFHPAAPPIRSGKPGDVAFVLCSVLLSVWALFQNFYKIGAAAILADEPTYAHYGLPRSGTGAGCRRLRHVVARHRSLTGLTRPRHLGTHRSTGFEGAISESSTVFDESDRVGLVGFGSSAQSAVSGWGGGWAQGVQDRPDGCRMGRDRTADRGVEGEVSVGLRPSGAIGLIVAVVVVAASVHDNAIGTTPLDKVAGSSPSRVIKALVDQGFKASVVEHGAKLCIDVEIVERNPQDKGFVPQPIRWRVEQTNGLNMLERRLVRDDEHARPRRNRGSTGPRQGGYCAGSAPCPPGGGRRR